jgi:hypothetical protein
VNSNAETDDAHADDVSAAGKNVSAAGKIYEQMVGAVVAAEFDRKKTLEGRGTTILTTSGSLLALIFGLTVVVSGKDPKFGNHCAILLLMASLLAFVVSAVIGIFIAINGSKYTLAGRRLLESLTGNETWEDQSEDEARRMWVKRQVNTSLSLRRGNNRKAKAVTWSLAAQVLAVTLLSVSLGVELWPKLAAAAPKPATVADVCAAQEWPRLVPQVVGVVLKDAVNGSLACWDNLNAIAPDGHDPVHNPRDYGPYRITSIAPAPGTPTERNDGLVLYVAPVDLTAPPAFHPCDWVTADQAAKFLGVSSTATDPTGDEAGSAEPFCSYKFDAHFVTSQLSLPSSFPVDAQTELNMLAAGGHGNDVTGLPGRAYCSTGNSDGKTSTTLQVLLSGNRLYQALGWHGESCDTLEQFAQTAIPRIGS